MFVIMAATVLCPTVASARVSQYGTADDAKAMLFRAVAAVKENKAKALEMSIEVDS